MPRRCVLCSGWLLVLLAAAVLATAEEGRLSPAKQGSPASTSPDLDFNRHILPILAENCFACHGPDEKTRKARLRLDTREGLFGKLKDGGHAVVAGKPEQSAIIERITATDAHALMPPPKSGKKLKADEVQMIRNWVAQGAPWVEHWAFQPPRKPVPPKVHDTNWVRNPIDFFILARLEAERLAPAPEADKTTLIRRLTLDLTGLPPTPAEVDAFLADSSPNAYQKVVDRLLASPRYGEHMARFWLDLARYGDTHGLHLDNYREMWPYRDWVIRAFNANLPYDRFIIEQLAGDLLPNATLDQQVATGFNRCHVTTSEGGSIVEEVHVRNVVDRTDTTGVVFMGLSVGCARCHDHKFDPIRARDYYSLYAFFNSIDGNDLDGNAAQHPPIVRVPTPEQKKKYDEVTARQEAIQKEIDAALARVAYDPAQDPPEADKPARRDFVWIDDELPKGAQPSSEGGANPRWTFVGKPEPVLSGSKSIKQTGNQRVQFAFTQASPNLKVGQGDVLFAFVYLDPQQPPKEIMLEWNSGQWQHRAYWGENLIDAGRDGSTERRPQGLLPEKGKWVRLEVPIAQVGLKPGAAISGWAFNVHGGTAYWDRAGIYTQTPQSDGPFDTLADWLRVQRGTGGVGLPPALQSLVKLDPNKLNPAQIRQLRDYFVAHAYAKTREQFAPLTTRLANATREREALERQIPTTLVFKEAATPRQAYILNRGEYDQRGEPVDRATPAFLPPMPTNAPKNRLGLAQWLVHHDHPLTARVAVNRFWQQIFGTGLVKTSEDFGTQGERPSHPELLDWLAVQFMEDGWDVKLTLKRMVMSSTYRQSSRLTPEKRAKDPANRLLSRGPRYRLDAETLRDQALFVSGLLVEKLGGPSVKPPQPPGLWEAVGYTSSNTARFTPDRGPDKVHRRSLYTFWKRTAPPPQMSSMDAPSREACITRRERTNTPLHALLLMNETQYVEAARALAERTLREGGPTVDDRLTYLFRLATARRPDKQELVVLRAALDGHLAEYAKNGAAAQRLIAVGESTPDPKLNPSELAAWTMLANLVLNLDEVVNRG